MITINEFLKTYGVKRGHLQAYGLTFYVQARHGDTQLDELPTDYHMMFMAVLTKYGYFCEGCND